MRTVGNLVYRQGRLALAALHDVNLAATYCSHVLMLFGAGEWLAGPAPELLPGGPPAAALPVSGDRRGNTEKACAFIPRLRRWATECCALAALRKRS